MTGRCECDPGWRGARCDKRECVRDGGNKMKLAAEKLNMTAITRICQLPACLPGTYGASCAQQCDCQAGVSCHHETGRCGCPVGLTGTGCEQRKNICLSSN